MKTTDMRLLIVDDDIPTVDAMLCAVDWRALGIGTVETAYSAAQARRVLSRGETDIVVSDIEMPQGSGLELLAWVRERRLDVEFILLTCHERFDYAASALKLNAVEYLTKPFDPKLMALTLQKTIAKIRENRRLREGSAYGEWLRQNQRQEEQGFWLSLFGGVTARDAAGLQREIDARALPLSASARFRLVAACVAEHERAAREIGQELLFYLLEGTFSRCLCGQTENRRVVRRFGASGLWLFAAVDDAPRDDVKARCAEAITTCAETAHVRVTCCVGAPAPMAALGDKLAALQALIGRSVAFFGQAFGEEEAVQADGETAVLDGAALAGMLDSHDKAAILNALKDALASRAATRTLSERTLGLVKQELLQAVYTRLAKASAQATTPPLLQDEDSVRLGDLACRSSLDMLRFANYLLERAFACEETANRAGSLAERVDAYLRAHFREDVDRGALSAAFFLAPEYLAKLYKKKTGRTIKDALRACRVAEAKRLLRDPNTLVSDVAAAVGYDNFSYFTTIFKRETGTTPQEYRRACERQTDTADIRP